MRSRSRPFLSGVSRSVGLYNSSRFTALSINGVSGRGISTYASKQFTAEWSKPEKQEIAKDLTLQTIVETVHPSRKSRELPPPLPPGKEVHPSLKYAHGSTYGKPCAVDKIFAVCPEHILLMRTAIGIARSPDPKLYKSTCDIAFELGDNLAKLSPKAVESIFEIGSSVKALRSKDVVKNPRELVHILKNSDEVPPQKLLRVLEVAASALGVMANAYGGSRCRIAHAKAKGEDVAELDRFMKEEMMPSLGKFYVPYIKAPGSPFAHLQMQQYAKGAQVSPKELVTINHYLECCSHKEGDIPDIPQLRSVVVKDPTGRTLQLHDHMNLPHFFDVSGHTGTTMQALLGLLHKAGKSPLEPQDTILLGMLVAGCNYYKQGYHNYYEVLPALHWVNHHVHKQNYVQMTPMELLHAVPDALKECVDPKSKIASSVVKALDLVTDHFELHYELFKQHVQVVAKKEKEQEQAPSTPTLGGSEGED